MNFWGPLIIGIMIGGMSIYLLLKEKTEMKLGGIVNENPLEAKVDSLHLANIEFRNELNALKIQKVPKAPPDDREKIYEILNMHDSRLEDLRKKAGSLEVEFTQMTLHLSSEFNKFSYGIGKDFLTHMRKTQEKLDGLSQYNRHAHFEKEKQKKPSIKEATA